MARKTTYLAAFFSFIAVILVFASPAAHACGSGNETSSECNTTTDIAPPTVSITFPAPCQQFITQNITVNGTASDNVAVEKVEVRVDEAAMLLANGTASWSAAVKLYPGENNITAKATDTSGNTANVSVCAIFVPLGTIRLNINIDFPQNGQVFATPDITVNGTASDNIDAVEKVEVKVNDGGFELASGTTSWSKNVTLSPGLNNITARATNTPGATNETSVAVTFNATNITPPITPPLAITIVSPQNTTYNTTGIMANATTDKAALQCAVSLNGMANQTMLNFSATDWFLNLSATEGTNRVQFFCSDFAGNTSASPVVYFTVNLSFEGVHDVSLRGISAVPNETTAGTSVSVSAVLANKDSLSEENVPVIFSVDNASVETKYFSLSAFESKTITFQWAAAEGNHTLSLFANLTSDVFWSDNRVNITVSAGPAPPAPPVPAPPPSGGGGGGGGGGVLPPPPGNRNASFTNLSIPNETEYGKELLVSGCAANLDANSSTLLYVDSSLRDSEPVYPPTTCFNLSGGVPAIGGRIVTVTINMSGLTVNKLVYVRPPTPPGAEALNITGISAPDFVYAGAPVSILVFVQSSQPGTVDVAMSSDGTGIGDIRSPVNQTGVFRFNYTFSRAGNMTLRALASTNVTNAASTKKIEVRPAVSPPQTPTGGLIATLGRLGPYFLALLVLLFIILLAYEILGSRREKKEKEKAGGAEGDKEKEGGSKKSANAPVSDTEIPDEYQPDI